MAASFPLLSDICQMRLDFDNFDITETTAGVCTDSLTVTGPTGRNPMDLCGTLTGMHRKSHNLPPLQTKSLILNIGSAQTIVFCAKSSQNRNNFNSQVHTANVLSVEIADICLQSQSKNKHLLVLQIFVCD